ncbi:metallophosphoesterase [Dongia soli]|uniref:Metallophosphoesterase n=1 Tax=Dongia soli TaxID=600628 RepID=A0ABU5EGP9_9PROT|nr:metallophosphoesterase [Dongia soli]MDY0885401.1 metallophosphoesterase [Dongia soli]
MSERSHSSVRIAYFSDIHIEVVRHETRPIRFPPWTTAYPLELGPDLSSLVGNVDLVILAGDIGVGDLTSDESAALYASQVAEFVEAPVVFVPGNHEYYGTAFEICREKLLSTKPQNVAVLDRSEAFYRIGKDKVRILGATLWTDYALFGNPPIAMAIASDRINDHRRIAMSNGNLFSPWDAAKEHHISRLWLDAKLREPHNGHTVIVTHHVPHPLLRNPNIPAYDPLAPAFQSDCSDLLSIATTAGVKAWIFGHNHFSIDRELQGVRMLSAQTGYPREQTGWRGVPIFEI